MKAKLREKLKSIKMYWYRYKYELKTVHKTFYMGGASRVSSDLIAAEHVFIAYNCVIYPNVSIGKYTMLAPRVSILGGDHNIDNPNTPIIFSGRPTIAKTKIGEDVWIGAGVTIKAGVSIGNGVIIGASAVVTKDIPAYSIYAGNPAKFIRMRFTEIEIEIHKNMLEKNEIKVNHTKGFNKE